MMLVKCSLRWINIVLLFEVKVKTTLNLPESSSVPAAADNKYSSRLWRGSTRGDEKRSEYCLCFYHILSCSDVTDKACLSLFLGFRYHAEAPEYLLHLWNAVYACYRLR